MYLMIASIRIAAQRVAEWEAVMKARRVRAREPATRVYDMYRSAGDPLDYVVIEGFADEAGAAAHLAASTEHEAMIACFDGKPQVRTFWTVPGCAPD